MIHSREQTKYIIEKIISLSSAKETFVSFTETTDSFQPFVSNALLPSGNRHQQICTITTRVGDSFGSFVTNKLDEASLKSAVNRAIEITKLLPSSPAPLPFIGPIDVKEAPLHFPDAGGDVRSQQEIAMSLIEAATEKQLTATGSISQTESVNALGSSNGLSTYQASTNYSARFHVVHANRKSTGFAEDSSYDPRKLDLQSIMKRAIDSCLASTEIVEFKPGKYDVILSPSVVADFLYILLQQFHQQSIIDKQSFLAKMDGSIHLGSKLFPSTIHVFSDPMHEALPAIPFSATGEKISRQEWIKDGVINEIIRPRAEAMKENRASIPFPSNIILAGGTSTLDELISKSSKAILVHHVANVRLSDPTNCLLTGVTKDGLFFIEDGKIKHAIKNMRFSETPVYMLKATEFMSQSVRASGRYSAFPMLVPAIKMIGFQFLQSTDFV